MSTILDISLPVTPTMPIYPGNQETVFETITKPSGSKLTTITMDSHAGTHIDAPSHAGLSANIETYPLEAFYGTCRVIEMFNLELIEAADLADENIQAGERILFKTNNSLRGFDDFYDYWTALSADAAAFLAEKKVALVGIDWFGIKQKNAPTNEAHTALLEKNIPILEGINLAAAKEGTYTLAAFPVAYKGIDGAATRAVLIKD